jgi:hypothetical protein
MALYGRGRSTPRPFALPPGKTLYPLYRRLAGPQGRSGRVRNILPPLEFDPRNVQPVASHYTDWTIPTYMYMHTIFNCRTVFIFIEMLFYELAIIISNIVKIFVLKMNVPETSTRTETSLPNNFFLESVNILNIINQSKGSHPGY